MVIEDAHEMDEQSWKVLLSLVERKDAWTYSLFVLTHESQGNLERATLASEQALGLFHSEPSSSAARGGPSVRGGPSNAATTIPNLTPPLSSPRGGRANTTTSTTFHDTMFLRMSYESTLNSLKQLKKGMPYHYPTPYCPNLPLVTSN